MTGDDNTNSDGGGTVGASRARIIAHAQERCHQARTQYIEAENTIEGGEHALVAAAELHNAVIEYFYALRPLKDEDPVEDFWDDVVLWTEQIPVRTEAGGISMEEQPVTGFDQLAQEAIKHKTVQEERDGYLGKRVVTRDIPIRLPPDILLRISAKLDQAAGMLGFKPSTDDGTGDTFRVSNRDPEDYDDPVKDDIPKPE